MKSSEYRKKEIDFENFLMEKHASQYVGTDDMMVDDFSNWLENLFIDEWLSLGDKFIADKIKEINQLKEKIRQADYTFKDIAEKCEGLKIQIEDIRSL